VAANFTTFIDAGDKVEMSQDVYRQRRTRRRVIVSYDATIHGNQKSLSINESAPRSRGIIIIDDERRRALERASNGMSGGGGGDRPFSSLCLRSGVQARIYRAHTHRCAYAYSAYTCKLDS